jgi:hypothetical protein
LCYITLLSCPAYLYFCCLFFPEYLLSYDGLAIGADCF